MSIFRFVFRSIAHYRRTHLSVILGTALSAAILVGALLVGDSVRGTLRHMILMRLYGVENAIHTNDRFFHAGLEKRLSEQVGSPVSALLHMQGVAVSDDGSARVNRANVYGVSDSFRAFSDGLPELKAKEAAINPKLADRLNAKVGDEILVRVEKVNLLPGEAPMSVDASGGVAFRCKVVTILEPRQLANLSLRNETVVQDNLFLNHDWMAEELELVDKANMLIAAEEATDRLNTALRESMTLEDVGFELRDYPDSDQMMELRSDQVFLPPATEDALLKDGKGIITYFVNQFKHGDKTTPYSFVSAPGTPRVPESMTDNEIILNKWLAKDLDAKAGGSITVRYYVVGAGGDLDEASREFKIHSIIPMDVSAQDRELMPRFPGLADAESCTDWDPGLPVDTKKIRDEDEEYWDEYKGTPKAYVTISAAKEMWSSRFGVYTAVHYEKSDDLRARLTRRLTPDMFGLQFIDVKDRTLKAASTGTDFGQLFIGLSMFIIAAALILTALLFAFSVEQRREEMGLLLALGFTPKQARRMFLLEGAFLSVVGSAIGIPLGVGFNQLVLDRLATVWEGAVNAITIQAYVTPQSIAIGAVSGILAAFLTMWFITRKQLKRSASDLQSGPGLKPHSGKFGLWIGVACIVIAAGFAIAGDPSKGKSAMMTFFGGGACLLIGGLGFAAWVLRTRDSSSTKLSTLSLALRNNTRNRGRSMATIGLLAAGIFLIAGVAANRHDPLKAAGDRKSGTGGYYLYGESALPVLEDLNTEKGRKKYLLQDDEFDGVSFVQMRLRDGGDASCLNLNRVFNPRILGVDPEAFADAGAFAFAQPAESEKNPWLLLNQKFDDGAVPAIADMGVLQWSLFKKVGDTLEFTDENGRPFRIRFVAATKASIFQGSIIIANDRFIEKYPSNSGSKVFLVDVPKGKRDGMKAKLSEAMQDAGMAFTRTKVRLAEFSRVESTYLSIFLALGALGLVIGSLGLGIVIFRNILERRNELGVLRACGYGKGTIRHIVFLEHLALLIGGLIIGVVSAAIAILPAMLSPTGEVPWGQVIAFLLSLLIVGVGWTFIASSLATKGKLLDALRNE